MKRVALASVDLNLLVVLDALLRDGSCARAAKRLGRTSSAVSHSLARLRDVFGDPLFVRAGAQLKPTPRAQALRAPLDALLQQTASLIAGEEGVDLRALARTFVIGCTDLVEVHAIPPLVHALATTAPHVNLVMKNPGPQLARALQDRDLDVAFITRLDTHAGIATTPLFDDDLCVALRAGHPALKRPLTVESYAALAHVLVAPKGGEAGPVDDALQSRGLKRRIAVRTPTFHAALQVVAQSDLVVALPTRFVHLAAAEMRAPRTLVTRPLPLPTITHSFQLAWSELLDGDAAHRWFRAQLQKALLAAFGVERASSSVA